MARQIRFRTPSMVCILLACLKVTSGQPARPQPTVPQKAQPKTDVGAQAAAQRLWDSILAKCGDSYYVGLGTDSIRQFQRPSFRVLPYRLSEADRANGYRWVGDAILTSKLWRGITKERTGEWVQGAWQDGDKKAGYEAATHPDDHGKDIVFIEYPALSVAMWERNGRWHYSEHLLRSNLYGLSITDDLTISGVGFPPTLKPIDLEQVVRKQSSCNSGNMTFPSPPFPKVASIVWSPVPDGETLGALRIVNEGEIVSFFEIVNPSDESSVKLGKTVEFNPEVWVSAPNEFRYVLYREGGRAVMGPLAAISDRETGRPGAEPEGVLVRWHNGRVGLIPRSALGHTHPGARTPASNK